MRFGFNETCLEHDPGPRHPETADRLEAIRGALADAHDTRFETPAPASPAAIESIHEAAYVASIESVCAEGGGALDADTVANERTWDAALASAGLAMWAGKQAAAPDERGEIPFALGRPPGHHALVDAAMGFCIFNNAAIAAQACLDEGAVETVAILDWDVHHGNGTQEIFAKRADVPYASIHEEGLYPGTGALEETGSGAGAGATLNIPLSPGAETPTYLAAITEVVDPWVRAQGPDLVLVSAGFDAHRHDPISRMAVSTEGFGLLTERLLTLAESVDAEVAFVLEGGYGLDTLADGVSMVHEVCAGYEPVSPDGAPRPVDRDRLAAIRTHHGLGS